MKRLMIELAGGCLGALMMFCFFCWLIELFTANPTVKTEWSAAGGSGKLAPQHWVAAGGDH